MWWEHVFATVYWFNVRNNYVVDNWEVHNEPNNSGQGWAGTESQYMTFIQYTADAIHWVYSHYLPGRTPHIYAPVTSNCCSWALTAMQTEGPSVFDSLDFHDYQSNPSEITTLRADMNANGYAGAPGRPNLNIYNNNFISDGTVNPSADDTIVWGDGKGTFVFNNNAWHRVESGDDWYWNGDITSFSGWQAKGFDAAGMDVNPQINGTLGGGPVAYQLDSTSPLINKGANLSSSAPGGVGTRDYYGNTIPNGGAYDIGAAEYTGSYSTQQSNATPVAHTSFSPSVHIAAITNNGQNIAKGAAASWSVTIEDSSGNPVFGVTVECFFLNQSWQAIDADLTSTTNSSGVASFSTNATSSSGTYFLLLPEVRPPSGTYYDSSQNTAWDTYFNVS